MAASEYPLTAADWTDCGASDDATLQTDGKATVIFTTAAAKPAVNSAAGLKIGLGAGLNRDACVQKPGVKLWARAVRDDTVLTVER